MSNKKNQNTIKEKSTDYNYAALLAVIFNEKLSIDEAIKFFNL